MRALVGLILLASCATIVDPFRCLVPAVRGREFRAELQSDESDRYWTPTSHQVDRVDEQLRRLFSSTKNEGDPQSLDRYVRQYVGVIHDGKKLIWVNAFERTRFPEYDAQQACKPFQSADGGCDFWRIDYRVKTGQLSALSCNGIF